ncbi:MAG: hypothetical protein AABZ64_17240 [Nitrospinota bacterium]
MDVLDGQPRLGLTNLAGLLKSLYYQANPEADPDRNKLLAQLKTLETQVSRSVTQESENLRAAKTRLEALQRDRDRLGPKVEALRLIAQAVESSETQEDLARQEQRVAQMQDRIAAQEISVRKAVNQLLSLAGCVLPAERERP